MGKNKNQYVKKQAVTPVASAKPVKPSKEEKPKSIYQLLFKLLILAVLVCGAVCYTDKKGYFESDASENHTERKWESYYKFTQSNEVDIVMVGNSRLYTGINPTHLSNALGANCFCLASPGTNLSDAYYCLKEAISVCKPKIAIVETGTISNYDSHHTDDLFYIYRSFYARKNLVQKLTSMPLLFTPDHYLAAWSNTVRNHSFIFEDEEQLKKNINHQNLLPDMGRLYLGRYVRFNTGIEDSTLLKYDLPETPKEDGNNFAVGDEAREYLRKTVELCRENDIELIFLSIPIYYKLTVNYEKKKAKLEQELSPYNPVWLDLQSPYDTIAFNRYRFENIANPGQHMTYSGSMVATYKLAHFIHDKFPDKLKDRSGDSKWRNLFHGEEGFFENNPPNEVDSVAVLFRNIALPGGAHVIKEVDLKPDKDYNLLMVKIDRQGWDLYNKKLRITLIAEENNQSFPGIVDLKRDKGTDPVKHYFFFGGINKGVKINKLIKIEILDADK
jgi:hypothetical protein